MNRRTNPVVADPTPGGTLVIQPLPGIGDIPIDEVAALLSDCGLFVGNDTGVYNLAAAVHTPAIGLFNGRYPPLAYSPFLSAITPAVPGSGTAGIGVDQVLAYVRSLGSA